MTRAIRSKRQAPVEGDQVLQEVWRLKDELSAAYGHDVKKLFAQARRHQAKGRKRPLSPMRGKTQRNAK
jgi:hypothetical protein